MTFVYSKFGKNPSKENQLTKQIIIAMLLGMFVGLLMKSLPIASSVTKVIVDNILNSGGLIFTNLIKVLVIPVIFLSLLAGICGVDDSEKIGKVGLTAFVFFIVTTVIALILAVMIASFFNIGHDLQFPTLVSQSASNIPTLQQFILDIFPSNPFKAFADGNVLQVIVFAVILGLAIRISGDSGKKISAFIIDLNEVFMKSILLIMKLMPYGVFCLLAFLFAKLGTHLILQLLTYFLTVIFVLVIHTLFVYSFLLQSLAQLSPQKFFKKFFEVMLFGFSISSSNATLPLALKNVEQKLGVDKTISSLVLSLGTNINKNGTAIMQGVATIFIAHAYNVELGFTGGFIVVLTSTLASISTAGAPSAGIIALAVVLKQVGLPLEGIAVILSVDRILDMLRTSVNIAGNAVIACVIAKRENKINLTKYNNI